MIFLPFGDLGLFLQPPSKSKVRGGIKRQQTWLRKGDLFGVSSGDPFFKGCNGGLQSGDQDRSRLESPGGGSCVKGDEILPVIYGDLSHYEKYPINQHQYNGMEPLTANT